jgi:hypothetical protein
MQHFLQDVRLYFNYFLFNKNTFSDIHKYLLTIYIHTISKCNNYYYKGPPI